MFLKNLNEWIFFYDEVTFGPKFLQKKRKLGSSLLVLGTGSGDVLALDVSAGQLKWRVCDCHPGYAHVIEFIFNALIYL